MDKNAIKKFAVWARRELIERVSQRAMIYGITSKDAGDPNAESVNGHLLSQKEKRQRQALIRNIKENGYEQVMEEVGYTWFNRFAALRFMEVNGYLPSHIRVFTNDAGEFKPQILAEAIHLELDGLDMNKVYELESANKSEELFKYLLIVQCNALNSILPRMFQRIDDYTELLLPDYLLREGSVIEQMISVIPEEDWTDQVEIIGWLYQYYIAEPKDALINARKQYKDQDIPFVTQLFTSDWIVHFMVENSLGRLWLEGHPNDALKSEWKYYLDEAEQERDVQVQLATIRKEYAALKPEEIRVIDPCMGSGHILCVLFDVLVRIYEDYGYTAREAAVKIVENNLWGLDIDERAAQLSYFAVMMKARQYDRRFFTRMIQPHTYAFEESNGITSAPMHDMGLHLSQEEYSEAVKQAMRLVEEMQDAKEYGSIIHVTPCDWDLLRRFAIPRDEDGQLHLDIHGEIEASARLQKLIDLGEVLAQKYNVVVTNPPYMSSSYMPNRLKEFVQKNYTEFKNDMFSVFIKQVLNMTVVNGHIGLLMPYVWMFISSYEKVRDFINQNSTITTLVQLEYNAFEAACVPVAALTLCKNAIHSSGEYIKLSEFRGAENQGPKTIEAVLNPGCGYRFTANQDDFCKIPGAPMAYWVGKGFVNAFSNKRLRDISRARRGLETGNNNKYIHYWYEVSITDIDFECTEISQFSRKWLPHNKGGDYRTWFGNDDLIVWFKDDGKDIRESGTLNGYDVYLKEGVTWTALTSSKNSFRFSFGGHTFDSNKGPLVVDNGQHILFYLLAFFNSPVAQNMMKVLNPTMSLQNGDMDKIPIIIDWERKASIDTLSEENVLLSKQDWDSFETSRGFEQHPLVKKGFSRISDAFSAWEKIAERRYATVKNNEEKLNEAFIDIYNQGAQLTPSVEEWEICIRKADLKREIRSLLSYAVGCMFGRYSLDSTGIAFAGGSWDTSRYISFLPDKDAIIPICDDEYFEDDVVGRFVKFIETVYGKETLEENLRFIADVLGGRGSSREVIRSYFINEFYADHLKVYQKRPIYWLFDSGKKNGFKCLIYMHRYQPDTVARIRTDYVHEQQSRYRTAIAELEQRMNGASTSERVKLSKRMGALQSQADELRDYEEKIHHLADQMIMIDLDDGVKYNYDLFGDVLAKIK